MVILWPQEITFLAHSTSKSHNVFPPSWSYLQKTCVPLSCMQRNRTLFYLSLSSLNNKSLVKVPHLNNKSLVRPFSQTNKCSKREKEDLRWRPIVEMWHIHKKLIVKRRKRKKGAHTRQRTRTLLQGPSTTLFRPLNGQNMVKFA